ncbi:uncharacterized protein PHALS_08545 [Plasmopara halstedii]|uniref:Uncharacterized protein n=1 Tax=Plasmopara halstedii TaxID=4781 RepID=A0A0P1ACL0_PLAHL|nr:uncharacterized protein PHALS_08545 [Plasmopara halstedii]CEG38473.1 hypothetical protein PHALS_08545 [Plasmopara halstedii]|eukprot:XP_024574842.1 hypothetical protein PHALS_08545 [Plasmopara halstedii]
MIYQNKDIASTSAALADVFHLARRSLELSQLLAQYFRLASEANMRKNLNLLSYAVAMSDLKRLLELKKASFNYGIE